MTNYKGDLVVSRFNENVDWLSNISDYNIFLYNKGEELENSIPLPNIGRETHTYFNHIVNNYDTLSEWSFFVQGSPFDHVKDYVDVLESFPLKQIFSPLKIEGSIYFLSNGVFSRTLYSEPNGRPHHFDVLDLDSLWSELFEGIPPKQYPFTAGAIFIVNKEVLLGRPLEFYKKCLRLSVEREHGPWEFERMFPTLFDPINKIKV